MMGEYTGYIIGAYGVAAAVLLALLFQTLKNWQAVRDRK
jgi:heme exporter protein CcmD